MRINISQSSSNEINNLKNQLLKANKVIEGLKIKINDLQNQLNIKDSTINNLKSKMHSYEKRNSEKNVEINVPKPQLKDVSSIKIPKNVDYNDIMCVNFISSDQNIHFAAKCIKTDTFAVVEEKLYRQFPHYRETNNTFIANGTIVLRFKTIEENKIGNGLPVTLIVPA